MTPVAAMGGSGGGFSLDFRIDVTWRQAAGLLLAASLWMGAGYLFFDHLRPPTRMASSVGNYFGISVDAKTPLGGLLTEYDVLSASRGAHEASDEQALLWDRLEVEFVERRGESIIPHIRQLRTAKDPIELLRVDDQEPSTDGMLLVSAKIDGVYTTAVFEPSRDAMASQDVKSLIPGVAEPPHPNVKVPHLFLSRYPGGFAYEAVQESHPLLVPALLPDSQVDVAVPLGRSRSRSVRAVAISLTPS